MSNRNYNVFFHLHTVSGIIISVGLYVIFFAGSFALFLEPIAKWELNKTDPHVPTPSFSSIDYDRVIDSLEVRDYPMYGRYMYIYFRPRERFLEVYLGKSTDSLASEEKSKDQSLMLDTDTYTLSERAEFDEYHFTIAELLYGLHFFEQLGEFGLWLSGAIGLMLLFAMVSGIVVHWKKIVSNFYIFRPKEKLKTVWTDAHTALGIIGIPYQLMYAVTGAMFGISVVIGLSGSLLYGGDHEKLEHTMYDNDLDYSMGEPAQQPFSVTAAAREADKRWPDFKPIYVQIFNLGSANTLLNMYGESDETTAFPVGGTITCNVITGEVIHEEAPFRYPENIQPAFAQLHFGRLFKFDAFAAYLVKILYFVLGIATCFVIITGVLIWLEARNKKSVPEKERIFNERVGRIYMAICLSMFPIIAFSLLISKLLPHSQFENGSVILNSVFFGGWLLLSIFFSYKKSNNYINYYSLLSGGILGLAIPLIDVIVLGNVLSDDFARGNYSAFVVDVLWLVLSVTALYAVYRVRRPAL